MVTKTEQHNEALFYAFIMFLLIVLGLTFLLRPITVGKVMAATGFFLILTWASFIPMLYKAVPIQWELGERECASREEKIALMKSSFLTQEIVDRRLRDLASAAEGLFSVQVHLRENNEEAQLDELKDRIIKAKDNFWETRKLARSLGFIVHDKIKDYTG